MGTERQLHDVSCLVHVHSTYSDGSATVPELLDDARRAGADALLLTDHDSLGARDDGWEGDHKGVFLLVGLEVSPKHGHYLAFGVEKAIPHAGRSAREIATAVRDAGGVGFAAHPFSRGGQMLIPSIARRIVLPHGWPAHEEDGGTDGIELWSVLSDAAEAWRTPAEAVRWLRDPEATVASGPLPAIWRYGTRSRLAVASLPLAVSTTTSADFACAAGFGPRCPTGGPSGCSERTSSASAPSAAMSPPTAARSSPPFAPAAPG